MNRIYRRLFQSVITLVTATSLGYFLTKQLPGGPIQYIVRQTVERGNRNALSQEELLEIAEVYVGFNPEDPVYLQLLRYLGDVAQLDFGTSIVYGEPVVDVIVRALPWTLFILSIAMLFNTILGIGFGAWMAYREGSPFDVVGSLVSVMLTSVPYYMFALLFVYFLAYQLNLFPTSGRIDQSLPVGFNWPFIKSALYHATLPAASMVFTSFASLGIRANSISVLGSDYVRVARLRGLTERRIVLNYVLRNAILPWYTGFVMAMATLFGGAVIMEKIFGYTGVGWYLFQAAVRKDIPLLMGSFVFLTFAVVIALLFVDFTYQYIDPRAGGVGNESY